MDQKELPVAQPSEQQEAGERTRGPVELDASLFGFVSGGLPRTTWDTTSAVNSTTTL